MISCIAEKHIRKAVGVSASTISIYKGTDQTAHMCSLNIVLIVRCQNGISCQASFYMSGYMYPL